MCGIFCAFDKGTIKALADLNSYRGSFSYSIFSSGEPVKEFGKFDIDRVPEDGYKICHVQAPTTSVRDMTSIHPARESQAMLWHNGIIKNFEVQRLKEKHKSDSDWDTLLLLLELQQTDWLSNLSEINGSFACVLYDAGDVYVFRNEISPLFYDDNLSVSSVKFHGCKSLPPNKVFLLDTDNKQLVDMDFDFTTKENPYYMEN